MDTQREEPSEWCTFESSQFSDVKAENSPPVLLSHNHTNGHEEVSTEWNADFDAFEVGNSDFWTQDKTEEEASDKTVAAIHRCFTQLPVKELENVESDISTSYSSSSLFAHLHLNVLDPVKWEETQFHRLKLNRISDQLSKDQICERWIWNLNQVNSRVYEEQLDFHTQTHTATRNQHHYYTSSTTPTAPPTPTTNHTTPVKESALLDAPTDAPTVRPPDTASPSHNGRSVRSSVIPNAQSMRKKTAELENKTASELKALVDELERRATVMSEMLCTELDYRDRLKRDIEGANNFISSHAALQRKVDRQKDSKNKQKNRYGLFQNPREGEGGGGGGGGLTFTIPYIEREGGPRSADLQLITRILEAMERGDHNVSKLISDYVLKLGDHHNLQTVIQVRSKNGVVTSLNKPEGRPNTVDDL